MTRFLRIIFLFVVIQSLLLLLLASPIYSQVFSHELEKFLEQLTDNEDQTELLEQLEDWLENPLDMNQASKEEMLLIPGFPAGAADEILAKRKIQHIATINQVKQILNVEDDLWNWISQFITIKSIQPKKWHGDIRFRWVRPLERSKGFREDTFVGTQGKFYQRYRIRYNSIQVGGVLEKDNGESSFVDHRVFGLEKSWGGSGRVVIGNYTLNIGMGLALWSPFSIRKGSAPFYVARHNTRTIRPHYSAFEASYFEGIAFTKRINRITIGGWLSDSKIDASLTDNNELSSFVETGLHRTNSEREKRNKAWIRMLGGLLGYQFNDRLAIQFIGFKTDFEPGISKTTEEPPEFNLAGKQLNIGGFNLRGELKHLSYFAEVAWNENGSSAVLVGGKREWPGFKVLGIYRYYSPKYDNPFAHGFGERDGTNNEIGWYLAVEYRPVKRSIITAWFDQFKTPWRTFNANLPQKGSDWYFQWSQKISPSFQFYLRYTDDTKTATQKVTAESVLYEKVLLPFSRRRVRFHLQYKIDRQLQMSARFETVQYSQVSPIYKQNETKEDRGWILFWEVRKSAPKSFLTGGVRFTFFDTQSFDTRLYQFEQDLPGVLTNKLLFGRGIRWYIFGKVRLSKSFMISAKYASTRYEDRESIGSGLDEILSSVRHDVSLQLDVRF